MNIQFPLAKGEPIRIAQDGNKTKETEESLSLRKKKGKSFFFSSE